MFPIESLSSKHILMPNQDKKPLHYISPLSALITMQKLVKIALKSKSTMTRPSDLEKEMDELPTEQLLQINEDLTRIIKANS